MPMETAQLAKLLTAVQEGRLSVARRWRNGLVRPARRRTSPTWITAARRARGCRRWFSARARRRHRWWRSCARLLINEGRALADAPPPSRLVRRSWPRSAGPLASGRARDRSGRSRRAAVRRGYTLRGGGNGRHQRHSGGRGRPRSHWSFLASCVQRVYDVGVAGIHRLINRLDVLRQAQVVIAVAGMEGALASVLGGLWSCPVVAVPTSIGYGASFGGLAALLAMLNSCAPGVAVVNIDNGLTRRGACAPDHALDSSVLKESQICHSEIPHARGPACSDQETHAVILRPSP